MNVKWAKLCATSALLICYGLLDSQVKPFIFILLLILLPIKSYSNENLCINFSKEHQNVTEIKANSNDNQLMKLYGVKFNFSSSIPSVEVSKTLRNTSTVKSKFGGINKLYVECSSDNALVFDIIAKSGDLKGFYLFKNGFYHAGPLLYFEGEVVIIKSDESDK